MEYFAEYTLSPSASFRASLGVRPHGVPMGRHPFLAWKVRLPEFRQTTASRNGQTWPVKEGQDGNNRIEGFAQPTGPDRIALSDGRIPLVQLTGLGCGGTPTPAASGRGREFVVTFYDGPPDPGQPLQWSWTTMVWTPGTASSTAMGRAPLTAPAESSLVVDPGFEDALARLPVSARSGQHLPGATLDLVGWTIPPGGRLVHAPAHTGQAAVELCSTAGEFALVRQHLQPVRFPPGSRWRLSAWIKGDRITPGNEGWKKGMLLIGLTTEKWAGYSSKFVGTFDGKPISIDVRIPDDLRNVTIEAGLNGATGKMWIDDVELSRQREPGGNRTGCKC